jgi:hypothetical protein
MNAMSTSTRREYLEAAFSLGALIAENPPLLREVENLMGNGFRGLDLPRGVRVRARSLLTRIRRGPDAPAGPSRRREDRVIEPAETKAPAPETRPDDVGTEAE